MCLSSCCTIFEGVSRLEYELARNTSSANVKGSACAFAPDPLLLLLVALDVLGCLGPPAVPFPGLPALPSATDIRTALCGVL